MTSEKSGKVFVDGVEASSFGLQHSLPNTYYHLHRAAFAVLRSVGTPAGTVHAILGAESLVGANMAIGDAVIMLAKYLFHMM